MITLSVANPAFSGERAGIRFHAGKAEVAELTGAQRLQLTRLGVTIQEPRPNAAGAPSPKAKRAKAKK